VYEGSEVRLSVRLLGMSVCVYLYPGIFSSFFFFFFFFANNLAASHIFKFCIVQ
jgi:hypothetical protein